MMHQASPLLSQRYAGRGFSSAGNAQRTLYAGAVNESPRLPQRAVRAVVEPQQRGRHTRTNVSVRRMGQRTQDAGETAIGTRRPDTGLNHKTMRANIMIATLNINGGGTPQTREKWQHIDQLLRSRRVGILVVQETHLREETVNSLHKQFHQCLHIINSSVPEHPNVMGVTVVLNKNLVAWKEAKEYVLVPGRAILVSVPWYKDCVINVIAVYAPNRESDNASSWDLLRRKWLTNEFPKPDILLGDFNCVEANIDRLLLSQNAPTAARALEELKSELGLLDGWQQENPNRLDYSWSDRMGRRSRLDRIYVSEEVLACSREWLIKKAAFTTDHSLVSVNFSNPGAPYIGRGRWAMPLFLLKDHKVMTRIKELGLELMGNIEQYKDGRTEELNPQVFHRDFKREVQMFVCQYARTVVPKLDRLISRKEKMREDILNDASITHTYVAQTKAQVMKELPAAFPEVDQWSYPTDAQLGGREDWEDRAHLLVSLSPEVIDNFSKGYEEDPFFKQYYVDGIPNPRVALTPSHFRKGSNGLLYFIDARWKTRLCVPHCQVQFVLEWIHEAPHEAAHGGYVKTVERVHELLFWKGMNRDTERFCETCDVCQKMKINRSKKMGALCPSHIPSCPFETVSLDLITGLPSSGEEKHTAVLVIVDKLTKFGLFIPTHDTLTQEGFTRLFVERVVHVYGMLHRIIAGRDR